jgi:glycosyltransferase involved in cell wall biosynthesis
MGLSALLWVAVLALPWRPWSTRERLDIGADAPSRDLSDITVLMPARNEVACIAETLRRLDAQGLFNRIVVIDDQSDDGTKEAATELNLTNLLIIDGAPPPAGWSGKLWALHQGLQHAESKYVLLLDADIGLASGTISALLEHLEAHKLDMASLMANLHMRQFWEKLLLPPFVYFFKMIYPFALANSPNSRIAAGAGGCVLIATTKLQQIGGFSALKGAIIDDCT